MITQFKNKFGSVTFRPVTEITHVKNIRGADVEARCLFDVETAEKLALITENHRVQICPTQGPDGWRCYVVLHEDSANVAVAEIEELTYIGGVPAAEIHNAREMAHGLPC